MRVIFYCKSRCGCISNQYTFEWHLFKIHSPCSFSCPVRGVLSVGCESSAARQVPYYSTLSIISCPHILRLLTKAAAVAVQPLCELITMHVRVSLYFPPGCQAFNKNLKGLLSNMGFLNVYNVCKMQALGIPFTVSLQSGSLCCCCGALMFHIAPEKRDLRHK